MSDPRRAPEFQALLELSAKVGADPALVQGPGGNTSLKDGGLLWVKASGTWLAQAGARDIMVPVRLDALNDAVARNDPAAEKAAGFVLADENPSGLRPSIETTFHALLPQRVVVHVHCVETIALAVRAEAEALLADRLDGLNWILVPYARPGLPLTRSIRALLRPGVDVIALGNHGLIVAADTAAEAERLLSDVRSRLAQAARPAPAPDLAALREAAAGGPYRLPRFEAAHGIATDPVSLAHARAGSLYPDHVIFLGPGSIVARPGETAATIAAAAKEAGLEPPVAILFPGRGVVMRDDATEGAQALAQCLADVAARIPAKARLRVLDAAENAELLDWDAEKYRQALARRGGGGG